MSADSMGSLGCNRASTDDREEEVAREVAHMKHEARLARSRAADAMEDRLHDAKRAAQRSIRNSAERLEDIRDESARYVRHRPLRTMAVALGAGVILGLFAGRILTSRRAGD